MLLILSDGLVRYSMFGFQPQFGVLTVGSLWFARQPLIRSHTAVAFCQGLCGLESRNPKRLQRENTHARGRRSLDKRLTQQLKITIVFVNKRERLECLEINDQSF